MSRILTLRNMCNRLSKFTHQRRYVQTSRPCQYKDKPGRQNWLDFEADAALLQSWQTDLPLFACESQIRGQFYTSRRARSVQKNFWDLDRGKHGVGHKSLSKPFPGSHWALLCCFKRRQLVNRYECGRYLRWWLQKHRVAYGYDSIKFWTA